MKMTDKYEEFKEWFKKNNYVIWKVSGFKKHMTFKTVISPNVVFDIFEEEQAEKDKKEEIIMEITKIKMEIGRVTPSGSVYR